MEKDTHITTVIFRFDKEFGVYALFPYSIYNTSGLINSYAHVGQHSGADYNHCVNTSRLATEDEYKDLFNELENGVGYNLKVAKKRHYYRYANAVNSARLY